MRPLALLEGLDEIQTFECARPLVLGQQIGERLLGKLVGGFSPRALLECVFLFSAIL